MVEINPDNTYCGLFILPWFINYIGILTLESNATGQHWRDGLPHYP